MRVVEARIANGPGANGVWDEGETVEAETVEADVRFRPGAGGHDRRAAGAGVQIARVPAGGLSLGAATIRNALGRDASLSFEAVPVASSVMEVVAEPDGVWTGGDEVTVAVTFNEPVTVRTDTTRPWSRSS